MGRLARLGRLIRWRPRLRTLLSLVLLLVVLLPLGSVFFLRVYENELVQRTEAELIAQGAVVAAAYKSAIINRFHNEDNAIDLIVNYGNPLVVPMSGKFRPEPILPILNVYKDRLQPSLPPAEEDLRAADDIAYDAGGVVTPMLKEAAQVTLAGINVLDYNGIIVATTGKDIGLSMGNVEEVQKALDGIPDSIIRLRDKNTPLFPSFFVRTVGIKVFVTIPVILEDRVIGAVLVWRTPKNILKVLYDWRKPVLLIAGIVTFSVFFITWFFVFFIQRPVNVLAFQAKQMANATNHPGDISDHFHITSEYMQIADAMRTMFHKITLRSKYINEFAQQMSLVFQKPLASIHESISSLQQRSALKENKYDLLQTIESESLYLERLISRLLQLAQAEVFQPSDESADLEKLLKTLAERYKARALEIKVSEFTETVIVPVGFDLLDKIFSSLFDNTLQFGGDAINIAIAAKHDRLEITFEDNGPGIARELGEKVFVPFFTTHQEKGATGLGLSIAYVFIEAHHGTMRLVPSEKGAIFIITLPRIK